MRIACCFVVAYAVQCEPVAEGGGFNPDTAISIVFADYHRPA